MSFQPWRSVVLLSGGLDSAANLALCARSDEPVLALTCRYGQRAQEAEVRAARDLCDYYQVKHVIVDLPWLGALGSSSLTHIGNAVPELAESVLDDPDITRASAKSVWVPNRNGVLLQVAAAFAESLRAARVVVGFNREEAATFPDNTVEFLNRSSHALSLSTATQVQVFSYTADYDKSEIVRELLGLEARFPFEKVWSCYLGGEKPCGKCESCGRLARALGANGVIPGKAGSTS